ncbi:MAG: ATP-binding protein, partial [bacterium]|nr:ATP-binding protein [bacterium]
MDIMDKATRDRFKALLLELPFWNRDRERLAFVRDTLYGHEVAHHFRADGEGPTVASELLDLCAGYDAPMETGLSPICTLLAEIRERGLATGVRGVSIQEISEQLNCRTTTRPDWSDEPYPGLLALDHWQAPIFFGRTVETRELLRRLGTDQGRRFLIVTGVSGSGKSSLVRAGVWAALTAARAPNLSGSGQWLISAMFPAAQGGDPFLALTNSLGQDRRFGWLYPGREAEKLKREPGAFAHLLERVLAVLPEGAEWLLILDQMEELFTPAARDHRDL